jgi:hypothetical protein
MTAAADIFMERIIISLLPFFLATTANLSEARAAIVYALGSYGARTQSEISEAAQIIALGFCTVDSLAESTEIGMSVNKRLRLRGSATALVRSKKSCQQALANSIDMEVERPAQPSPAQPSPVQHSPVQHSPVQPEPIRAEAEEAALGAAVQRMREKTQPTDRPPAVAIPAQSAPAPRSPAAPLTQTQQNAKLWASVMTQVASTLVQNDGPAPG